MTKSDEKDTNNADTQIVLKGLKPATTYVYQIIRTNSAGQTATSPAAQFTTSGFTVVLHFVNDSSANIVNVAASIKSTDYKELSDKEGTVRFKDVKPGEYTVTYVYNNVSRDFEIAANENTLPAEAAEQTTQANLEYYINVDKASVTSKSDKNADSNPFLTWAVVAGVIALAIILLIIVRRRKRNANPYEELVENEYQFKTNANNDKHSMPPAEPPIFPALDEPTAASLPPPPPAPKPVAPPALPPPPPAPSRRKHDDTDVKMPEVDVAAHTGQSLKQMVMQSLAEDAARRRAAENQGQQPGNDPQDRFGRR
jgi:hypothetical protein